VSDTQPFQYPPPPLARLDTAALAASGQPVVLRLWPQGTLRGRTVRFDTERGEVEIEPGAGGAARTVAFDALKMLKTLVPAQWSPATAPGGDAEAAAVLQSAERDYEIEFRDGDRARGHTRGFRDEKAGLSLFPAAADGRVGFLFVPRASLAHFRIGPLFGQSLVESGLVEGSSVASALDEQKRRREEPLGARLQGEGLVTVAELEGALERQRSMPDRRLGEILIEAGLVTAAQLDEALAAQRSERSKPLGEILVAMKLLDRDALQRALAEKLGIPKVDLRHFYADPEAARRVPEEVVRKARVVPLYEFENRLVVATDDPLDWQRLDQVAFAARRKVDPVLASPEEIERAIDLLYTSWEPEPEPDAGTAEPAAAERDAEEQREAGIADNVVVAMVNRIILNAWHEGASDIHVESGGARAKTLVRVRRDGVLRRFLEIRPGIRRAVVARIKVMAGLDPTERREPQDGRIDMRRFSKRELELRVAVLPTVGGEEDVVMRVLSGAEPVSIARLGFSRDNHERMLGALRRPHGLILVCGPTGSGKTTTLHSLLAELNSPERKIWTAEDPVELVHKGVRQLQVHPGIGLTFAIAMRAFLRADPDVIMIGEMRDAETAGVAVEAALTGHLVLSTLHTNSAPETVSRLLDLGLNPFNFADSLVAVLSQRLVRTLCPACRQPVADPQAVAAELVEEYRLEQAGSGDADGSASMDALRERLAAGDRVALHAAKGCDECAGSGYKGRIALHELLLNDPNLRRLVQRGAAPEQIRAAAIAGGMQTLKQDGIAKVLHGLTDPREMRRACA